MPTSPIAVVDHYLGRLPDGPKPNTSIWRSADGSVHGQFFACTLTSEFQPIHAFGPGASPQPVAYEGVARGVSPSDQGVSVWRMLDGASSDDESIALDRLCRVLHAINFFRQPGARAPADLYLSVHDRLLAAVSSNHGDAFLHILDILALPQNQIVLQLPAINPTSRWLANYVADNYRRNGFRLAFAAGRISEATQLVKQFQPHAVTLDARALQDANALARLLEVAQAANVAVIVKKLETTGALALLEQASHAVGTVVLGQGDHLAAPGRTLQADAAEHARETTAPA